MTMSCLRLMPRLVGRIARREKTSSLRLLGILSLMIAAAAAVGWSQAVNATLLGTVTDATGAVVPNAKLTITETQTGIIHASKSNESGNWIVPDLPPGALPPDKPPKGETQPGIPRGARGKKGGICFFPPPPPGK